MTEPDKKYCPYEWEGFSYPLIISSLRSQMGYYNIPFDAKLKIWRDEDYRLKGLLTGVINNHDDLEYKVNGEILETGFVSGDEVLAADDNYEFLLKGVFIDSISFNSTIIQNGFKHNFSAKVSLEKIQRIYKGEDSPEIISEWYLCSMPEILFSNRTSKYQNSEIIKVREGIDAPIENKKFLLGNGFSGSWNFAILNYENYKIIIQEINPEYLPNWTDGICIEYRNISFALPSQKIRKMIREYIAFIFGSHIQLVGATEYSNNYKILNFESQNPWKRNVRKRFAMSPVPLKNGADRMYFEKVINKLLLNFAKNFELLGLSDSLWKLWIGSEQSIGVNLPILASGLETLIDSYLEKNRCIIKYSKSEKCKYKELVLQELTSLEVKLKPYQFGQFVLNKMRNPYNLGIGEKMKVFFDKLGFEFDKDSIENQALQARNKMTHQRLDSENIDDMFQLKKLTDAYITLFHRVILKILGYNGYYIDYSKKGLRHIDINRNM